MTSAASPSAGTAPAGDAASSAAGPAPPSSAGRFEAPEPPSRPGVEQPEIRVVTFDGPVAYREGLELQRRLARERIDGGADDDLLLLLEHEPVLTLGRGTGEGYLAAGEEELAARGVEAVEIERGGDVTYHGPGQLVGYPILDLRRYRKDLHWYLRSVEAALISALGELGLPAFRVPEHTGVWVGDRESLSVAEDGAGPGGATAEGETAAPSSAAAAVLEGRVRKLASIGVHVSRWVTWHGFALNVTDEALENFDLIVPCGIEGVTMTSLASEGVGVRPRSPRLREAVGRGFAGAFAVRVVGGELP
jgi:lipoyl(octanoyl) transferase